jgi:ADP-ribose pyrophosphatase
MDPSAHQTIVLAETRFLRLVQDGHWTYAQRPHVNGAIAMLAVTPHREMLLVEQYRIPVRGPVIELPAGLVGDLDGQEHETLLEAEHRELLEEVGYRAGRMDVLTDAVSSAGLTDESVHLLWARDLIREHEGGGDGSEQITVHHVACDAVHDWLRAQQRQGKRVDYKVFAALYFLSLEPAILT